MRTAMSTPGWKLGLVLIGALLAAGCRDKARDPHQHEDHPAASEADHEDHGDHSEEEHAGERHVELASVRGVSFVAVDPPRQEGAWFPAEAVSASAAESILSSPVSGIVVSLGAEPGTPVARGAVLVELRSPEVAALKGAWLSARARQTRAASELEREQRLLAGGATSQRDVEAARAEAGVAAAEEEASRLALEARGLTPETTGTRVAVRASQAGIVAGFEVSVGQGVEAGKALARLVAPGAGYVQVELPPPGPESWAAGETTEVRHADGRRWQARVDGLPPALSAETRRLRYRLRVEGRELPLSGTPLEVRVPLAFGIVVPQVALQQIEGVWGVFVRSGEEAQFRPVRKGPELGGDVLVLAGIQSGETLATEGAYLLKSLYLKQAGGGDDHGH